MTYLRYEDICQGNSIMSRSVITIITIFDILPSDCQGDKTQWADRRNRTKNMNMEF